MINKLEKLQKEAIKEINECNNFEELKLLKSKYINKNEVLIEINKSFRNFSIEEKKTYGSAVSEFKSMINELFNESKKRIDIEKINSSIIEPLIDSSLSTQPVQRGYEHPLNSLKLDIIKFFESHGYTYVDAPIVEEEKYNFDNLNLDKFHPARVMQDTFYLDDGKLLRTHSTNATSRHLELTTEKNTKFFTIGKVFRNDDDDSTHHHQFNQIDILDIGEDANMTKLVTLLKKFMIEMFSNDVVLNFRPSYFPFTEPSFEVDIKSETLGGNGWIEVLGCGLVNDEVIKLAGKDPEVTSGFAIGVGLERIAMLKWGVDDIRHFYESNIEFLKTMDGDY